MYSQLGEERFPAGRLAGYQLFSYCNLNTVNELELQFRVYAAVENMLFNPFLA